MNGPLTRRAIGAVAFGALVVGPAMYAEYLRAATTVDLFAAALPGVAGIAGFTLLGAYAGYRQARAVQAAMLPPVPTRFLL